MDDTKLNKEAYEYSDAVSHNWWEDAMKRFNSLTDEEKEKYNQFIGFNDFSDFLLNLVAEGYKKGYNKCIQDNNQTIDTEDKTENNGYLIEMKPIEDGKWKMNIGNKLEVTNVDGEFYVSYKKPNYPKTFWEAKTILCDEGVWVETIDAEKEKLGKLYDLIICRNVYWKLANNWKPDYTVSTAFKYCIGNLGGIITKSKEVMSNHILSFPTEEMRDEFLKNFKELIEECKIFL